MLPDWWGVFKILIYSSAKQQVASLFFSFVDFVSFEKLPNFCSGTPIKQQKINFSKSKSHHNH